MKKPIIFVYGPTGSGKTALSYDIIRHFFSCNKLNKENVWSLIKKMYKNHQWQLITNNNNIFVSGEYENVYNIFLV
jgi:Cdc6-like AAA superfamily ATPase